MAITYTVTNDVTRNPQYEGQYRVVRATVTLSGTYSAAGGFTLTPADFGLNTITEVEPSVFVDSAASPANAVVTYYNPSTGKLVIFWGNAGTASILPEPTGSPTLTNYTGVLRVRGY